MAKSRFHSDRSIMVVGECTTSEFEGPLKQMHRTARVRTAPHIAAAAAELQRGESPYLIVLAQTRRGQFTDRDIAKLAGLSPLSHFVALLGAWAEGEPRTGAPLNGVSRVYWHQWNLQMSREWLSSPASSRWAQPRTMTLADRSLVQQVVARNASFPVSVFACCRADYEAIADALSQHRIASSWLHPAQQQVGEQSSTLVWDMKQWDAWEAKRLRQVVESVRPERTLVLLGWPRVDDIEAIQAIVKCDVLSKPYFADDVAFWASPPSRRLAA